MTVPVTSTAGMVLEGPIAELREREIRLLYETAEHIGKIQPDGPADRKRLIEAADDLREMFLMVAVIGEFNAGKSTFVNALLGEALLPVGPTPTTDMIELVRYAPTPTRTPKVSEDSAVREWGHPNTGSAGVAIVDTPGTGSVFQKHEEIAKSFLHRSDLVIFLLSAKRAFADTERIYLEMAKNFGKKIIIVINQADLLDPKEQTEVRQFVQRQIDQLLNLKPSIFMVSAKKALQNARPGALGNLLRGNTSDADDYGMDAVRKHLQQVFEQVPPARQKLITRLDLLRAITARHQAALGGKLSLIGSDTNAAEALQREITQQASSLDKQLAQTMGEVSTVLTGVKDRGGRFIEENVNVIKATLRGLDRDKMTANFEREVLGDAMTRIASTQEHYVNALVDGGRAYWRGVIDRLSKMEALLRDEAVSMDASTYADQRTALQAALTMADIELKAYTDNRVIEAIEDNYDQNVRSFIYSAASGLGGVLAFIASAAAAAAPGVIPPLAAIGAILGPVAFVVGGGAAVLFWRRAVSQARKELDTRVSELEDSYRKSLSDLTIRERNRLVQYGQQILAPVFSQLQALAQRYKEQQEQLTAFDGRATEIVGLLNKL